MEQIFCFLNNKNEAPTEALQLWRGKLITVIDACRFKGMTVFPVIPPSFIKEGGKHTFSLLKCHELEKAGKIRFVEVRKGLLKGIKC